MRIAIIPALAVGLLRATAASAQGPDQAPPVSKSADADDLVARMLTFDKDKSGTLSRAEVTDTRLAGLFDRADLDKDGVVTKAELTALAAKEHVEDRGFGPPGGFGGPGGPAPGGPGGPGGPMMGMPRPGEVLPPMLRQGLRLSAEQSKQVDQLQKEVDAKLDKILTADQSKRLKEMRQRRPGGFGGPGGRPPGGPGGPPPGGPGGPPPGGPELSPGPR